MNRISLRLKNNNKKAITPVIATIILIAVTLVLALVVGAYTFGLFGSNVKTIQLTAGILNSGAAAVTTASGGCTGANFQLTFNNPGGQTYIESITLSAGGASVGSTYLTQAGSACSSATFSSGANGFTINNGAGMTADVFVGSQLNSGSTYSYVITFGNGQSITGALIAE
ncbi:MAG: type IV pilin [Thaumarchaeota archaeon]|nr:type IV pilin [Nitrososphaerota archaeon]